MKLYRIIAVFVCLMLLACAGALADGNPDISVKDKNYKFIRDSHGNIVMNDDDIALSDEAVICAKVTDEDGEIVADNISIEALADGTYAFPADGIENGAVYELCLWAEGSEEDEHKLGFRTVEFVEFDVENTKDSNKKCDIKLYPDGEKAYAVVVLSAEDSFVWHFESNLDDDVRCDISDSDNKDFDDDNMQNLKFRNEMTSDLNFGKDGERKISFRCGEDYMVEYNIIVCSGEDEFVVRCDEIAGKSESDNGDSETETTVPPEGALIDEEPDEEASDEPAAEPTVEATEEPTAEPTEEPTPTPTVEPTEEPTAEPSAEPTVEPGCITLDSVRDADDEKNEFEIEKDTDGGLSVSVPEGITYRLEGTCTEGVEIKANLGAQPLMNVEQDGEEWSLEFTNAGHSEQKIIISDKAGFAEEVVCDISFTEVKEEEAEVEKDTECEAVVYDEVHEGDDSISGTTEAGAKVKLFDGNMLETAIADEQGNFEFTDLFVSLGKSYYIEATDASGNYTDVKVEVKPYAGSDEEIAIELSCGENGDDELITNGSAGIAIDVSMHANCGVQLYRAYNGGEPEAFGGIIEANDSFGGLTEGDVSAHAVVEIPADKLAGMKDGTYEITARYDSMFAEYESGAVTVVIDTVAPEIPEFSAEEIADDAQSIEYTVSEDCTTGLLIDGERMDTREAVSGANTFYALPELKAGMKLSIMATDAAGNSSITEEIIVVPSKFVGTYSINNRGVFDAFGPVVISGNFLTLDENAQVDVMICYGSGRMAAAMDKQKISDAQSEEFDYNISFATLPVDMSAYPVDTDITFEVYVTADGERELLTSEVVRLEKDGMQLVMKIMLFVIVLIGFIAAVVAFAKISGRLALLKKAALDDGNDSNLTIRRRGFDRAAK